ncbi:MAG: protein kinase [Planctomycetes bacterium]|nr:protein kinase [Planctomycetota bacterium]
MADPPFESDRSPPETPRPGPPFPMPTLPGADAPTQVDSRPDAQRTLPAAPGLPEAVAAAGLRPDGRFGRYRVLCPIGSGGMGTVWKAEDTDLGRVVALKLIKGDEFPDAETLGRFLREAQLAARLHHPGIVAVHEVGVAEGRHYLTMDCVEGRTLDAYLVEGRTVRALGAKRGAERLREELACLADVAAAVGYAHAEGVIHRDLKPSNVLLDKAGRAYVTDFGLAKETPVAGGAADSTAAKPLLTRTGRTLGTPSYMSPEQADGDPSRLGPPCDVWALGVILYQILTGALPFEGSADYATLSAVVLKDPIPPRRRDRYVPDELEKICLKALEKKPERRYPTATGFGDDLRRWLRGDPVEARRPTLTHLAWRWAARRKALLAPLALAGALVVVALAGWRYERSRADAQSGSLVAELAASVERLEDALRRTPVPREAARLLARQPIGLLDKLIASEPRSGAAYAWRGRLNDLLGNEREADADYDRGCELSPESTLVWLLRGVHRLDRYARSRGLPAALHLGTRVEFERPRPETDQERSLREKGLVHLARVELAAAADRSANPADVRVARAMTALHSGGPAGCEEALGLLEGLAGPKVSELRALSLYHLGHFDAAVAAFDEVIREWPEEPDIWLQRADAWMGLAAGGSAGKVPPSGCCRRAIADLGEELRRRPEHGQALVRRGMAWHALGELEAAGGKSPDESYGRALLDYDAGLKRGGDLDGVLNNRGNAWVALAEAQAVRGEDPAASLANALADFDHAIRVRPDLAVAYSNRSNVHRHLGEREAARGHGPREHYARALADAEEAERLAPDRVVAAVGHGNVLLAIAGSESEAGEDPRPTLRRAVAAFERALRLDGELAAAYVNRGNAHHALGKEEAARGEDPRPSFGRALEDYTEGIRRLPGSAAAHLNRGLVWCHQADAEAARGVDPEASLRRSLADGDESLRLNARDPAAWSNRCQVRHALAQVAKAHGVDPAAGLRSAIADATEAVRLNPEHGAAYVHRAIAEDALAVSEAEHGREARGEGFARAIADYGEALKRNPADGASYNNRASAWLHLAELRSQVRGGDSREAFARAEADAKAAVERHCPTALLILGCAYRLTGRYEEAIAAFEAAARELPARAEEARRQIEATRRRAAGAGGGGGVR